MIHTEDFEQVEVTSTDELRAWLMKNHAQEQSIWLITYKKHVAEKYLSTSEVLDELLCFGWIDGVRRKLDRDRTMQLISPRRVQHWAKSYKDRAAKLIELGKMEAPGFRSIEVSKEKGLWNFMDEVDALIKPEDFVQELAAHPPAPTHFEAFPDAVKRFTLRWIKLAKKPETRARRMKQAAQLAAKGKKIPGS